MKIIVGFIKQYKNILMSLLFVCAVVVFFLQATQNAADKVDSSSLEIQKDAITKAAVQCYAIEGFYPPDETYLAENYGVIINYDKYIIHYEAYSSNMLPSIAVFRKKG